MKTKLYARNTDEQLVEAVRKGDKLAMGELYSRYYMPVFNKCLSFTKSPDHASDLAQDVMLKVIEKIKSFKGTSKFSTWLYSVTFNYCTDYTRKAKGKYFQSIDCDFEVAQDYNYEYSPTLEDAPLDKDKSADYALSLISKEDKELLLLKYQLNKTIDELQSHYNLSASAVKMRLLRARAKATSIYAPRLAATV
ncbi:MAG: sigma-70 family RNA polymerase sigma factor [Bacteroidota bacterium]